MGNRRVEKVNFYSDEYTGEKDYKGQDGLRSAASGLVVGGAAEIILRAPVVAVFSFLIGEIVGALYVRPWKPYIFTI